MIFKTLHMENIRSFIKGDINFPPGISLFEGDVGSGKSTILMAIEFALFGLGNHKGESLLRKRTNRGSVVFKFEVNGKKCEVIRGLIKKERNGPVRQEKGILTVNNAKFHLSPTELKEKILELLNFKEPLNPRAQSVIFRYAIYTPQEEMGYILSQKAELRLQTLRKAFGIEDYKIAAENATTISHNIKNKTLYLEGQTADLNKKKKTLENILQIKEDYEVNLKEFIKNGEKTEKKLECLKQELEELEKSESYIEKVNAEIPHLEKQIEDKNKLITNYNRTIQELEEENSSKLIIQIEILEKIEKPSQENEKALENKISYFKKLVFQHKELVVKLSVMKDNRKYIENKIENHKNKKIDDLKNSHDILLSQINDQKNLISEQEILIKKISANKNKLKGKKHDIQEKLNNLDGLGDLCPICGSKLNPEHKRNIKTERENLFQNINNDIFEHEKLEINEYKKLEYLKIKLEELNNNLLNLKFVIEKIIELNELNKKIEHVNEELRNLDSNILLIIENLEEFEELEDYIKYFENLLNKVKEYYRGIEELKSFKYRLEKNKDKIQQNIEDKNKTQNEIGILKKSFNKAKEELNKLETILNLHKTVNLNYKEIDNEFQSIKEKIITQKTLIKGIENDIKNIKNEIKQKVELKKQFDKLYDYHIWFNEYLIPTLSLIEKHVMKQNHKAFNLDFQKWFELLIDDNTKTGKINEEFTPIIEQDDIEQEINFLSGGEKTSVALSYRLALNNVVQKVSLGMKSNLLILDEPTDGFSKEQLYKVRDILNELDCPQIILVSHERELESFADNIFRIDKINGASNISVEN